MEVIYQPIIRGITGMKECSLAQREFAVVMKAGELLLANGAEIFRVEESMIRIARAFGLENVEVFILANGVFATAEASEEELFAKIKHIPPRGAHLGRVAALNDLSRRIDRGQCSLSEAEEKLLEIEQSPTYTNGQQILGAGLGSFCFSVLFGGTLEDGAVAMVLGLLLYVFVIWSTRHHLTKMLYHVLACALASLGAVLFMKLGLGNQIDKVIIGAIIPLVPGVAFTTAIRDLSNSDYLSGMVHMVDALLIAMSMAIGVGLVTQFYSII